MTRSLATSFCTILPVSALLVFGGETLKDFAFALLVGIASGTYSSIFIASPVLTAWKEREAVYVQRRRRLIEALGMVPAFAVATTGGVATPAGAPGVGVGRRSDEGDGRAESAPPSRDGAELEPEEEPLEQPVDEEPGDGEVEVEEAAAGVAGEAERGDGAEPPQPPRAQRAQRKKRSRQRRRKHGRNR
jgi:SecD/SecF fusion protein